MNYTQLISLVILEHVLAESGSGEPDYNNFLGDPIEDEYQLWESWMLYFQWYVGDWSQCSSTCGASYRYRTVKCTRNDISQNDVYYYPADELIQIDNGNMTWYVLITDDAHCREKKVIDKETCDTPLCTPEWVPEEWSQCDPWCGGMGLRTREIRCMSGSDTEKPMVFSPFMCFNKPRPPVVGMCDNGPCRHMTWEVGDWSKCSSYCGRGRQIRRISCISTYTGHRVIPSYCPQRLRPHDRQTCQGSCEEGSGDNQPVCYDDPSAQYCRLVLKFRLCSHDFYHKMCCVSCRARASYVFMS
ncbi:A disintegrin and metalloproteinase with thrombospondin motifs 6-like [Amphiura filiformis]|uniref:A disintegrin and metalloproteinase with thrombospondin motifs 6-like n=1 Tax=Amphiura filiformis TaxID=82378 RepID=UPI003B227F63